MPTIKQLASADKSTTIPVVAFDNPQGEWGILSNQALKAIKMNTAFGEQTFPSVEHYVQYMRDPQNKDYMEELLKKSPEEARELGVKHFSTLPVDKVVNDGNITPDRKSVNCIRHR
jgi:predicted NAD-dependent protein-ADP-ribosyltransferase YbiA (DUF1768 family)